MSLLKQYALCLSLAPSLIAAANTCQRQLTGGLNLAHDADSTCREAWEKGAAETAACYVEPVRKQTKLKQEADEGL